MKPHRGTLIFVLGILSIVVCGPLGIVGCILAAVSLLFAVGFFLLFVLGIAAGSMQ